MDADCPKVNSLGPLVARPMRSQLSPLERLTKLLETCWGSRMMRPSSEWNLCQGGHHDGQAAGHGRPVGSDRTVDPQRPPTSEGWPPRRRADGAVYGEPGSVRRLARPPSRFQLTARARPSQPTYRRNRYQPCDKKTPRPNAMFERGAVGASCASALSQTAP